MPQLQNRLFPIPLPAVLSHDRLDSIGQDKKFDDDGNILTFYGTTIISRLSPENEVYHSLNRLYNELIVQDFASYFAWLPPSSWHVTIFSIDAKPSRMRENIEGINNNLVGFSSNVQLPIQMDITGWCPLEDAGIGLTLTGSSSDAERELRKLRDELSDLLQVRTADHKTFVWHISLAYSLRRFSTEQHDAIMSFLRPRLSDLPKRVEFEPPEFTVFDAMSAYHHVSALPIHGRKAEFKFGGVD